MNTYNYRSIIKNVLPFIIGITSVLSFACVNDNDEACMLEEKSGRHETILVLNGEIDRYDTPFIHNSVTTRSSNSDWEDGARIYVQFKMSTGKISGVAYYNQTKGVWIISFNGNMPDGQTGSCEAYYFENPSVINDNNVELVPESVVYGDIHASYSFSEGVVDLQVHLTPWTGRVRFSGTSGSAIRVDGLSYIQSYIITGNRLSTQAESISLNIGSDGYTPYIYAFFTNSNRELTIKTDEGSFSKRFSESVLQEGQSGYIRVPTKLFMSGWSFVLPDMKLPFVSPDYSDPTWSNGSSISCFDSKGNGGNYSNRGYRLAHTNTGDTSVRGAGLSRSFTQLVNLTECGSCSLNLSNRHLFTDVDETVYGLDDQIKTLEDQPLVSVLNGESGSTTAQDIVIWNSTINLSKLVEVHSLSDTQERVMSSSEFRNSGFEIRFELTGLKMEGSSISESAYAAIQINERGEYILRPQLAIYPGRAASFEETKQDRTTVGHTPLVRVSLIDTNNNNRVLDYGYIRLVIIDSFY